MQSTTNETVVLGEASESDSEEISLTGDEIQVDARDEELDSSHSNSEPVATSDNRVPSSHHNDFNSTRIAADSNKKGFASSWLPFADASSSFAKLVTYTPYNLLSATMQTTTQTRAPEPLLNPRQEALNNISLLHRTLYMKNQQLHACIDHAIKQPYLKASRDLNSISQRLVGVQRIIQEVEIGVANIKREQNNLDMKIDFIK